MRGGIISCANTSYGHSSSTRPSLSHGALLYPWYGMVTHLLGAQDSIIWTLNAMVLEGNVEWKSWIVLAYAHDTSYSSVMLGSVRQLFGV